MKKWLESKEIYSETIVVVFLNYDLHRELGSVQRDYTVCHGGQDTQ